MVSIEDNLCRNCGEKFQEHPETRVKKCGMHAEIKRGAGNIISIVTITTSLFLLITILTLDNLHRWIMPIEQNEFPYLIVMIAGIMIALGLFFRNMKIKMSLEKTSNPRTIAPFAILAISCIGMTLILFAGEVDRFLTLSASGLLPALTIACTLGLILLVISNSNRQRKRGNLWAKRS
jgi:phosphoglycerol transferase MdoB-like AlkP superfamily enzyme